MAQAAKAALRTDNLEVVADRGDFKGEEILACEQAGVAVIAQAANPGRRNPGPTGMLRSVARQSAAARLMARLLEVRPAPGRARSCGALGPRNG
jgi:hypothetical protein